MYERPAACPRRNCPACDAEVAALDAADSAPVTLTPSPQRAYHGGGELTGPILSLVILGLIVFVIGHFVIKFW